jgi:hypothetical protein
VILHAVNRAVAAGAIAAAVVAAGCGAHGRPEFCGLVRTANGFDPVAAVHGLGCAAARGAVRAIESGERSHWSCSRAVHAAWELDCRAGAAEVRVLEQPPVRAHREGAEVVLANWTFRLRPGRIEGRPVGGRWQPLARPPFCIPTVPREALEAFALRPLTPHGGCFAQRR